MADFTIEAVSGLTLEPWTDPDTVDPDRPSRLNPRPGLQHTFYVLRDSVTAITIGCRVDGTLTPLDGALGGRLFTWGWVDIPYLPLPVIVPSLLRSSRVIFPAGVFASGHFTIQALRPSGGAVGFSFDVILP
jgi:hypothetical protein